MLAAASGASPPQTPVWSLVKLGTRDGIKSGLASGGVRFLSKISAQIYPLSGVKNWVYWLLQSEYTLVEFVHSIPYKKYLSRAAWEGLHALIRTVLDTVCAEMIAGRYPWLEEHILTQCEYLWRGIQGRNMLPTRPGALDLPATSLAVSAHQEWAPICHPVVEYSKHIDQWTPRMHAASEVSKWSIPSFASFLVGAGIDAGSYMLGKISWPTMMTGIWKEFYNVIGSMVGVATVAAGWAVWGSRLLPLLPLRIRPFAPMIVPQMGMAIGGMLFDAIIFPKIWPNFGDDSEYSSFSAGTTLESHQRQIVYGRWQSKFPQPSSFAPISPFFIHPQLGRLFEQTVFPERSPPSESAEGVPKPTREDELDLDDVTKLKIDLLKARRRKARELKLTPPITPIASQHNSDDDESDSESSSSSDQEDSESDTDSKSESTSDTAPSDTSSESESVESEESEESDEALASTASDASEDDSDEDSSDESSEEESD